MRSKRINLEGNTHAQEINRLMGQTPAASFNMKKNRCSEINQFSMRTWTRTEMMKLAPVYPRIQGLQRKDSPLFCLLRPSFQVSPISMVFQLINMTSLPQIKLATPRNIRIPFRILWRKVSSGSSRIVRCLVS
ncbi:uncharacterized protein isoform X2 [Castor canadensis]|uniref:Uncharacterized protein isoform X2 n=1 Tax=Castor canadensis TaxID=51338 RepID=A0AC58K353_CASCN